MKGYVFPGQGAQFVGMGKELYENSDLGKELFEKANEILDVSREKFPNIAAELSFETPNYKVHAGRFKDKIKGLKTLDTLKRTFPSAFLLVKKKP